MVRNYFFVLFLLFYNIFFSQLKITEIYHDTPYNERMTLSTNGSQEEDARKHHWGEFIEIYNYSDKPVSLENWYIKDMEGTFWLPSDKYIQPNEFMVVVYSAPVVYTTPFTELFSTTHGKDSQIIKQNDLILNNYKEAVYLGYAVGGQAPLDKGNYGWNIPRGYWTGNRVKGAWGIPGICYNYKSYQLNSSGSYSLADPNPLAANYVPPTQHYDDIVLDDFLKYYAYLDWSVNVMNLINNTCPISIELVQQNPGGTYNNGLKCFQYDDAGNNISATDCSIPNNDPTIPNGYSYDQLEEIKNSIKIYPNPVSEQNNFTAYISWEGPAINKINNLQIYNGNAGLLYGYTPISGQNYTSFSLQNQLPGIFIVNFTLNTGQVISKNILKW